MNRIVSEAVQAEIDELSDAECEGRLATRAYMEACNARSVNWLPDDDTFSELQREAGLEAGALLERALARQESGGETIRDQLVREELESYERWLPDDLELDDYDASQAVDDLTAAAVENQDRDAGSTVGPDVEDAQSLSDQTQTQWEDRAAGHPWQASFMEPVEGEEVYDLARFAAEAAEEDNARQVQPSRAETSNAAAEQTGQPTFDEQRTSLSTDRGHEEMTEGGLAEPSRPAGQPSDAELAAAIERGVEAGTLIEVDDEFLAWMQQQIDDSEQAAAHPAVAVGPDQVESLRADFTGHAAAAAAAHEADEGVGVLPGADVYSGNDVDVRAGQDTEHGMST